MLTTGPTAARSRFDDLWSLEILMKLLSAYRSLAIVALLSLSLSPCLAQDDPHAHAEAPAGTFPAEILERAVTLRAGIGAAHEQVTTSSKDAQAFYDQGLAYLHSYVWIEAARSFNQALRLDPKIAMAYVGLSRALSGLYAYEAARARLEQAQALGAGASERERRRIAILAKQLDAIREPGNVEKHFQYKKAIDDALAVDPKDAELWLLRGNAEEANALGHGQHGGAASIEFYQKALQVSPDNFAAHHYLTHSYENADRIEDALKHGEAYQRLCPAIPHAHHMYGHDLRRVGRVSDAVAEFRKADELERAYYKAENIPPEYDWHHEHNLDLLSTSYQHQGRMKAAEELMRQAFAISSMQDTLEFNKKQWPEFLIGRGRAEEALQAARTLSASNWDIVRAIGRIFASHADLAMNRLTDASDEAKAALKELQAAGGRATFVAAYLEALQGEFYLRTGQLEKGRQMLKQVARKIRSEPGPDAWAQALFRLEALAAAARAAGDWEMADYLARQMMEHDAVYAGSHFAMALVADQKKDKAVALQEFAEAEKLWRNADPDLPELQQARARIAALKK
jgi:tetratricopeptide (TPR) repeat protein